MWVCWGHDVAAKLCRIITDIGSITVRVLSTAVFYMSIHIEKLFLRIRKSLGDKTPTWRGFTMVRVGFGVINLEETDTYTCDKEQVFLS